MSSFRWVCAAGRGTKSGATFEDAAPLRYLSAQIEQVGPGGQVLLDAADTYIVNTTQLAEVRRGGTPERPVTVRGALPDGTPAYVELGSTRVSPWPNVRTSRYGGLGFRLYTGANWLIFSHMIFRDFGYGFVAQERTEGVVLHNLQGRNVRRLIGSARTGGFDRFEFFDIWVHGFSKGVIRFDGPATRGLIRDVYGDSEFQDADNYAQGIKFNGTSTATGSYAVSVEDCIMKNIRDTVNKYHNGDGFSSERYDRDLQFVRCQASDCTDAGFDLKSSGTLVHRCLVTHCKHSYRIWGEADLIECASFDPRVLPSDMIDTPDHLHLPGAPGSATWSGGVMHDRAGLARAVVAEVDGTSVEFREHALLDLRGGLTNSGTRPTMVMAPGVLQSER